MDDTTPILHEALDGMIRAVRSACRATRAVQSDLVHAGTLEKSDRSPVTIADLASQVLVLSQLGVHCPGVPAIAEEDSSVVRGDENEGVRAAMLERVRAEWPEATEEAALAALDAGGHPGGSTGSFFVLDPIDGTKGFLRGMHYAVALGLVENGQVVASAVGCPHLEDGDGEMGALFVASAGAGVWVLPMASSGGVADEGAAVCSSTTMDPRDVRLCESFESAHTDQSVSARLADALNIAGEPVRMDSLAKYAVVARGAAELYLRIPTIQARSEWIWDHAAGALLVEEAGGRVSDLDGEPLDFGQGRKLSANHGVIASNGDVHDSVLSAIAQWE